MAATLQASFPVAFAAFDPWPVSPGNSQSLPRDSPPCGMALKPSDLPAPRSFTHSFHRQSLEASCWPSPRLRLRDLSLLAPPTPGLVPPCSRSTDCPSEPLPGRQASSTPLPGFSSDTSCRTITDACDAGLIPPLFTSHVL